MGNTVCKRFFVSGRVQGVFFRGSTAQQAERLGVTGWARNLADGRVEVLARGDADAIAALEQWLRRGPPVARVDNVQSASEDPDAHHDLAAFTTA